MPRGEPAISVDTKEKELIGDFKNGGREYRPKGQPEPVRVHDFIIPELGRAAPFGVYDICRECRMGECRHRQRHGKLRGQCHSAMVANHGPRALPARDKTSDHRRLWWQHGVRVRLWKRELQNLANELGISITVCHLPPGTSQWNGIEHRLFSFITQNWRGKPLVSHQAIVQLIAATTTTVTGLEVRSEIDPSIKVSDDEMNAINILAHKFHGDWNYTVKLQAFRSDSS